MAVVAWGAGQPKIAPTPTPTATLRQVATRSYFNKATTATPKQMMLRTFHKAMTDITALQILEGNWYVNATGGEASVAGTSTITASVEYPLNVCSRILWNGGNNSAAVAQNSNLLSDSCAIVIPKGAFFAIRRYITNPAGIHFQTGGGFGVVDAGFGPDVMGYAASGIVDQTMSNATVTSAQATGTANFPAAIVGLSSVPAVGIIGDSRSEGAAVSSGGGLHIFSSNGDSGELAPALTNAGFANINGGIYGVKIEHFTTSNARQREAFAYCTHIAIERSINDLVGGASAAAVQGFHNTVAGYFPDKKVLLSTTPPVSTSTDSWATVGNQTTAAFNGALTTLNDWKRTNPAPFAGVFEVSDIVSSARNSGLWKANYTSDGTHENATSFPAIESALPPPVVMGLVS
jgi:hypothetical protein